MLSLGMFSFLAARTAVRKRGFEFASPPPIRAAMVSSRMRRVNTRPRLASVAAFLCLIVAHFECPDMTVPSSTRYRIAPHGGHLSLEACSEPSPLKVRVKTSRFVEQALKPQPAYHSRSGVRNPLYLERARKWREKERSTVGRAASGGFP